MLVCIQYLKGNNTMLTQNFELNRAMESMHRMYRFALLCSFSV